MGASLERLLSQAADNTAVNGTQAGSIGRQAEEVETDARSAVNNNLTKYASRQHPTPQELAASDSLEHLVNALAALARQHGVTGDWMIDSPSPGTFRPADVAPHHSPRPSPFSPPK